MAHSRVHGMSERMDWATPAELFDRINAEFHLDTDACATILNAKCPRFFQPVVLDGLKQDWKGRRIWCNPPYGREIIKWVKKAADTATGGGERRYCNACARTDRYDLVATVRNAGFRDTPYRRAREVRRRGQRGTLPVRIAHLRHAAGAYN